MLQPSEYGFYANVNPEVDHPRWSQRFERKLPSSIFKPNRVRIGHARPASAGGQPAKPARPASARLRQDSAAQQPLPSALRRPLASRAL